ncbi:uncharacterized protein LOC120351706 isoform X2 [Nilaparvata lugens]|uniref:uncharacterized protein LOC120351706 isoform X2 n=1 Tax=Nilaparvata lugens TaxID=108931 RepID=UPI00193E2BFB|nr:uncharacterized protein LOC120351706 isoform X2 [Nilaparvata lugens]
MPYIVIRGNLGMANTKVYGLAEQELAVVSSRLRLGPKNESKDELTLYNSVVYIMNQLEYFLGYTVVSSACQWESGQPMWTMGRPPRKMT